MMMKIFCPNSIKYRDVYFTKFSLRMPHVEFFTDFVFVTQEGIFLNESTGLSPTFV